MCYQDQTEILEHKTYYYPQKFELENGKTLPEFELVYHTWGTFDPQKNNVVWICHALTGNADPSDWWKGLVGENDLFNPKDYFIICANVLGSPYGSTSPLSINPETQQKYYTEFPAVTIRDMVRAFDLLREELGIERIYMGLGGSLGGQQVVEWAIMQPDIFDNLVLMATNAQHSPWGIAFNETQRMAIYADPTWNEHRDDAGQAGLEAARATALLSYRTYEMYELAQKEQTHEKLADYKASSYQRYQGLKLVNRFNVHCYLTLANAMDSHNVARGRGSIQNALRQVKARTQVIGVTTDMLFPIPEQRTLTEHIPNARLVEIHSRYGHDGFLVETPSLTDVIGKFMEDYVPLAFVRSNDHKVVVDYSKPKIPQK